MTDTQNIQTEADALQEIVNWSAEIPIWQSDALRRLVVSGELTSEDYEELVALCKNPELANQPLQSQHVASEGTGIPAVSLKNIRKVKNVNALAENQTLNFSPKGISIIYGDNGAGKSGYVRILKNACRARMRGKRDGEILSNIYEASHIPQSAEFEFQSGAQTQKSEWTKESGSDPLLSQISVFDSRTANVHVEETNDLAYTPYPMKLLEELVKASKTIKSSLDKEIEQLERLTPIAISNPNVMQGSKVWKLFEELSKDTKEEKIQKLCDLSDAEAVRLAELTTDFAQDPTETVRRLNSQKLRLETILQQSAKLGEAVSQTCIDELESLATEYISKRDAAVIASQNFSKDELVDGVGSESWRYLWEAARDFSISEAYPSSAFPNIGENARCLLCHQELNEDSKNRLSRFEAFVQDRVQKEADASHVALKQKTEATAEATISCNGLLNNKRVIADEIGKPELANKFREFVLRCKWRMRAMLRSKFQTIPSMPDDSSSDFRSAIQALETRARVIIADDNSEERNALRLELGELRDRQMLAGIQTDVLAEIKRLNEIHEIRTALKRIKQTQVTQKNTTFSHALITERLRSKFAQEIDKLELAKLAVELQQARSQSGVSRFKIGLIQTSDGSVGDVLSEGEFRCVALAGFLAELATNASGSGIVFDDPVSSLDHNHREAIAKRLAAEGRERQVIVFTHDLPFLFMLRNACLQVDDPALKTEVVLRHIQKKQNIPGHCRNEPPDSAKSAAKRIESMKTHLSNCRIAYDNDPDSTDWLINARGLIDSLRQTWESSVEDAISPVLRTFSSKVDTKGFAKLSAITEEDAKVMRNHYGQCSLLLHKASDALNPSAPTPDVIESELAAISSWIDDVMQRQNSIQAA